MKEEECVKLDQRHLDPEVHQQAMKVTVQLLLFGPLLLKFQAVQISSVKQS